MDQLSNLVVGIGGTYAGLAATFSGAATATEGFGSSITGVIGRVAGLATPLAALVGIGGAFATVGKSLSLAAQFEQTNVALTTMLGSAETAKAVMGDLQKFAADTPFEFPELASSAKQLIAFGVSANDLIPTLRKIGDVASGVGSPIGEVAAIFGKVKSLGTAHAEQLNQLAEPGIPIWTTLAKVLGTDVAGVQALSAAGKISFANVAGVFDAMTAKGGQFSGMMEKQSHTLGGLWSTLQDSVTMTLANWGAMLAEKLNLRAVVKGTSDWLAEAGEAFVAWSGKVIDVAKVTWQWLQPILAQAWGGIVGTFTGIVAAVTPVVEAIWAMVTGNFRAILTDVMAVGVSIYSVISGAFKMALDIATMAWHGIVSVVAWATGSTVDSTSAASSQVTTVLGGVGSVLDWLSSFVSTSLAVVGFAFSHWKELVELSGVGVMLSVVQLANTLEYYFTEVIPAYLGWFGDNWRNLLKDWANLSLAVWTNIAKNVVAVVSNLPGLIKGTVSLSDLWPPLTDGFTSSLTALPQIAERQAGPLEQALSDQFDGLYDGLSDGLGDALAGQTSNASKAADGILGAFAGLGQKIGEAMKPPPLEVKPPSLPPGPNGTPAGAAGATSTKEASAIVKGSAMSQRLAMTPIKAADALQKSQLAEAKKHTATLVSIDGKLSAGKPLAIGSF